VKGVEWIIETLRKDQSPDGSWAYPFDTGISTDAYMIILLRTLEIDDKELIWGAITGLKAVGISKSHSSIQKAAAWLNSIQNSDGGWGESCQSDIQMTYVPLKTSTLTDMAWALNTLIIIADRPTTAIQKGITYLLDSLMKEDWTTLIHLLVRGNSQ
jgi:squalene cyclase